MNGDQATKGRTILWILAIVCVGIPLLVSASWIVTETIIEATSDEHFCNSCHNHDPMLASYRKDVHGGKSSHGVQAKCVDCHLPHDNALVYLTGKAMTGMRDVWAHLTKDPATIDWQAMRADREHFVYDSGCLHCHVELQRATEASSKAFVAHKPYFLGTVDNKCVTCHTAVGHLNLGDHLESSNLRGNQP